MDIIKIVLESLPSKCRQQFSVIGVWHAVMLFQNPILYNPHGVNIRKIISAVIFSIMLKIAIKSSIAGVHEALLAEIGARAVLNSINISISNDIEIDTSILIAEPFAITNFLRERETNVKWVQSTFAGVEKIISADFPEKIVCTRVGSGFGTQMAEYCLGWLLYLHLNISQICDEQQHSSWKPEKFHSRESLRGKTIGILGAGDIGKSIAMASLAFGMVPIGFRRTASSGLPFPFSNLTQSIAKIMAASDIIVNCLPSTTETRGMLSLETFELCAREKRTIFINVGRGDVTSCAVIEEALQRGFISHAVLDVVEVEPLPPTHSIWSNPKVNITPHVSAVSTPHLVAQVFCDNLEKFVKDESLDYVVDFTKGY